MLYKIFILLFSLLLYQHTSAVASEENFLEPHKSYEIPMEIILPKKEECRNLLVPVCLSASHIACGPIRMEPVFMILGQSAGTKAALALEQQKIPREFDYADVRKQLKRINKSLI